jgi:Uncharacterized membrane protein
MKIGIRKLKPNLEYVRVFAMVFMIGFIIGIVLANMAGKNFLSQSGILSDYYLAKYKYMEINPQELFVFIISKRIKWVVLLGAMGLTALGVLLVWGYSLWLGFSAGFVMSVAVIRFGFLGVIFCIIGIIPHGILYIAAAIILAELVYKMSGSQKGLRFKGSLGVNGGMMKKGKYVMILLMILMVFVVAALMESYINPIIIKKFLANI